MPTKTSALVNIIHENDDTILHLSGINLAWIKGDNLESIDDVRIRGPDKRRRASHKIQEKTQRLHPLFS